MGSVPLLSPFSQHTRARSSFRATFRLHSTRVPSFSFFLSRCRTYGALWPESWDRGLAGSHDRWGFSLTPLDWTVPVPVCLPPARGCTPHLSPFTSLISLRVYSLALYVSTVYFFLGSSSLFENVASRPVDALSGATFGCSNG